MEYFFTVEEHFPAGVGFELFDARHIMWLAVCTVIVLLFCGCYRRLSDTGRRRFRRFTGLLILLCEVTRDAHLILAGVFSVYYLPLHLCGLAMFFCFYHCLFGGETTANFLYSTCMPGAVFALVFPDWTGTPAFCLESMLSFLIHALIVCYPLLLICSGELKPKMKYLPRCLLILLALAIPVYAFDRIFRANYMFLLSPAPDSPLEWFAGFLGSPGYILGYIPIIAAVWLLLYLPAMRRELKQD